MIKITREFAPADRYRYDFGLCSYENGFVQVDSGQDASYFGTWANPFRLMTFNYCEGDCTMVECDTVEEFVQELRDVKEWNVNAGYSFGIDPGLNEDNIALWNCLAADLLH